jgi:hypothetical protein
MTAQPDGRALRHVQRIRRRRRALIRQAMDGLTSRYEPAELIRIGFRLYEKFRSDVRAGDEGRGKRAILDVEMIRAAT